jgi:hypothetical protein
MPASFVTLLRKPGLSAAFSLGIGCLLASAANAAVILNDGIAAGSTVSGSATITTGAASYMIASTKGSNPLPTAAAGDMNVGLVATTSGVIEAQSRFTTTPITLAAAGDSVTYSITFKNNGIGLSGNSDTLYFGLYNSAGSSPLDGLLQTGLSASGTANTGGVQNWQGYVWQFAPASTTSTGKVIDRPAQTAATGSSNQDLVANNASGGTFTTPKGDTFSPNFVNASATGITDGATYTEIMTITSNGDGTESLADNFYQGTDNTGTLVANQTVTLNVGTNMPSVINSFDGLAFGWRHSGASGATSMDVSNITVSTNVAAGTPEPATAGVMVAGALALLARRRMA